MQYIQVERKLTQVRKESAQAKRGDVSEIQASNGQIIRTDAPYHGGNESFFLYNNSYVSSLLVKSD